MFCVSSQVTPLFWRSLVSVTKNCWLSCVGTETLTGVRMPLIPETSAMRSEEHTSELQSRFDLVCRLLLEKKKKKKKKKIIHKKKNKLISHKLKQSSSMI